MSNKETDIYYEDLRKELIKIKTREEEIRKELEDAGYVLGGSED
jgi:hypothetical protein